MARVAETIRARSRGGDDERGATLAVIALTIVLVLASGAVAVDLSALERQGQVLQNSADAAALAGVTTWSETQDAALTTAVVADVLNQNGVVVGADVTLDVSFPSHEQVEVRLTDTAPPVLLASVVGIGSDLSRAATAKHRLCDAGCFRSLDIQPPLGPISGAGSGDGFVPISVGNRVYAVNHHGSTIECIDRGTGSPCWPAQQLFSTPVLTMNTAHASLIGDRIYYIAWNGSGSALPSGDGWLQVGCWNTSIDARCSNQVDLFNVGHGTMYATSDAIYVFAANRDVYCFEPITFNECTDYIGGRNTALTAGVGWGTWDQTSAWNGDRVMWGDKLYVTLANRGEVWMHCWDLAIHAPCMSFAPLVLNGTRTGTNEDISNGRLFLYRDSLGTPTAICSFGTTVLVDCYDLDTAAADTAAEGAMTATLSGIAMTPGEFVGVSSYHAGTNRHFFPASFTNSRTYCHDFTTASSCGERFDDTAFGTADTYGYEMQGDCILGLGDRSIFFSFKPDMAGPCDTAAATLNIAACQCSGTAVWPPVVVGDREGVDTFEMRVIDPSGTPLLPADGSWLLLDDEPVDLDGFDTTLSHLTIEVRVTSLPAQDPWADGTPPNLIVGMTDSDPHLID